MRLTFLRHGETELNREKKVQGWSDSQLTATAVEKTVQCANYLKTLMDGPFDLGATSDTIPAGLYLMSLNCRIRISTNSSY